MWDGPSQLLIGGDYKEKETDKCQPFVRPNRLHAINYSEMRQNNPLSIKKNKLSFIRRGSRWTLVNACSARFLCSGRTALTPLDLTWPRLTVFILQRMTRKTVAKRALMYTFPIYKWIGFSDIQRVAATTAYISMTSSSEIFHPSVHVWMGTTISPCVDPGWASSASLLFWWQTLSSPCKHLDYAASCILSCCSFYLEFTSLTDSVVTKELHAFALQAA